MLAFSIALKKKYKLYKKCSDIKKKYDCVLMAHLFAINANKIPSGTSAETLRNPPVMETSSMDTEGGQLPLNPFGRIAKLPRTPPPSTSKSELYTTETTTRATYDELINTCNRQEQIINDLNKRIAELEARSNNRPLNQFQPTFSQHDHTNNSNWLLRQFPAHNNIFNALSQEEYITDEDELEKETSNPHNRNKKKRRRTKTKTPPKNTQIPLLPPSNENNINKQPQPSAQKELLPPPINVSNVGDFNIFRAQVVAATEKPVQFKAISNNDIKITTQSENDYRKIKKLLSDIKETEASNKDSPLHNMEYHTYQLKSERWYRIVIRGLPSSTNCEEIKTAIEEHGHKVTNIINVYKKLTVNNEKIIKHFPLFYVDLQQSENNKAIYEIKTLLYCKVTIEPPRKVTGIPQCTNCQQLGHTKNFCNRQAKCVKCAEGHQTKECKKPRNSMPTCVLCGKQGHPASYKGCEVYQRKVKAQLPRKTTVVQRLQEKPNQQYDTVKEGVSYAQAANNLIIKKQNQEIPATSEQTIDNIMKILGELQVEMRQNFSQLTIRVEKLEDKLHHQINRETKNTNDSNVPTYNSLER